MPETSKCGILILWSLKQVGKAYRMGSEVALTPETFGDPHAFSEQLAWDCSEIQQAGLWAAAVARVNGVPTEQFDLAARQYEICRHIPLEQGIRTPGALVFIQSHTAYPNKPMGIGHVALVIAPGYMLEARGRAYGVVIGKVRPSFNLAAKVDELY